MKKYAIILTTLMGLVSAADAQEVGFKGVPLGSLKEKLVERFAGLQCSKTPEEYLTLGEETCTKRFDSSTEDAAALESYAGQPVQSIRFGIVDGHFGYFSLITNSNQYDQIKSAVESSLGKGIQTQRSIQTMGGAKLVSKTFSISRPNGDLAVMEHAGQIDQGQVMGTSPAFRKYVERVYNEKTKKGSNDI